MKVRLSLILGSFLILAVCSPTVFSNVDQIFDSFGAVNCESEMAHLDSLAVELQNMPGVRAYIVIYGGKRGTYRNEVRVRGACLKRYLIETRGVSPDRIRLIDGGFRESFEVEVWIVPNDKPAPTASRTVDAKTVRFKKGKMTRYREPGCFPGKYLAAKM